MESLVVSLQELLKMGLGTKHPDHINIAILHNLLKIILQKVDVETHFVEITGPEVSGIRQMLCHSRNPIFEFKIPIDDLGYKAHSNDKVINIEKEINRLSIVVEKMEADLKTHFENIELSREPPRVPISRFKLKKSKSKPIPEDECFSSDCEDLCSPCDERNIIACDLLKNACFIKKLMHRSTNPIIERIFDFETVVGELNEKFQNFLNSAEDEYRKIASIEDCLLKLEKLKQAIDRYEEEFAEAIKEIMDMLTMKLNKVHAPALKKFVTDRLDEIEIQLAALLRRDGCPDPAGVIPYELQCLCCTTNICHDDGTPQAVAHVKGAHLEKKIPGWKPPPPVCVPCVRDRFCGGDHTVIRPAEKSLRLSNLIDDFGDKKKLRIGAADVTYFKGATGAMYRLSPTLDNKCS